MNINVRAIGRLCLLVCAIFRYSNSIGQEPLHLSIDEADRVFLQKNLDLLAGKLNVSAQKAAEIQARLYPNPVISGEINAIDPQNNKYFHVGRSGEKAANIEQVILLGGKRRNEIELARQSTAVAELELEDLLRNLRQQLHTSMYSVYFDERTLAKYDAQLQLLDTIITNYDIQAQKGNISLKEVVRLRSVYMNLNNDKTELLQGIRQEQQDLQLLLQTVVDIAPRLSVDSLNGLLSLPPADSLLAIALAHRPDKKIADMNKAIAAVNLRYQKSLAVPDLTVGGAYDQMGGAFANQVGLTLGMPLPLWHRNQGNIKMARTQIDLAGIKQNMSETGIAAEVRAAYGNMQRSLQEYDKSKQLYNTDLRDVFNGITDNFRKRNISIIEFVDFFESYNESTAAMNRIRKQVALCAEAVNYATGYPVY